MENAKFTHHVVINDRMPNNLEVIPAEKYKEDVHTSVFRGTEDDCKKFSEDFTEEVAYPLACIEELY